MRQVHLTQPTQIKLGSSSTPSSVLQLDYTYGVIVSGGLDTTLNNGNIQSQTVTVGSNIIKQSYSYDQVNRLLSAAETYNQAARWTQSYTFDQVGNRTGLTNTGNDVLPTLSTPTVSSSTNRISAAGYMYDNGGNLKDEPAALNKHYLYDAENRLVNFNAGATKYFYDGDGHRVKKVTVGSQTTTTVFVYNAGAQMIAEYTSDPVPPAAGGGGTSYLTTDHLGSTRVVTGTNVSQPVKARYDYLPYGEELPSSVGGRSSIVGYGGADSTRQKFTQKERDNESGLDYFLARYYSSSQGRFTSPDRPLSGQDEDDPQTWNLYGYTSNNPINRMDPDGERWFYQKNDKGKVTGVRWVNPNDDGSYTSPGDGWIEFVPREGNRVLEVFSPDGRVAYHFQENRDGSPSVFSYQTGKVEDATIGLVMDYLLGKAIGTVIGRAVSGFSTYLARRATAAAVEEAFEVASSGGRHSGFLKNYLARSKEEIRRGIKSIEKQIAKHEGKISNPEKHVEGWQKLDPRQQDALVNRKWPGDIQRQKEQIGILKELLKRK